MAWYPGLAIARAIANQDEVLDGASMEHQILIYVLANLPDQQIAKGLSSKSQGPNQPKHRPREASTMPTHANLIDNTGERPLKAADPPVLSIALACVGYVFVSFLPYFSMPGSI